MNRRLSLELKTVASGQIPVTSKLERAEAIRQGLEEMKQGELIRHEQVKAEIMDYIKSKSVIQWQTSDSPATYPDAVKLMEERAKSIIEGNADELVWLLEHPHMFTAGTSAKDSDLLSADQIPVYKTGRGGQYTYHGPGQRITYLMLDLKKRHNGRPDVKLYVRQLEELIINTLREFGVDAFTREGRVGVWVNEVASGKRQVASNLPQSQEKKIAAIGIRIKRWVTYHGIAVNINPDLSKYAGIVPCGISEYGVTSLEALGIKTTLNEFDAALKKQFEKIFS